MGTERRCPEGPIGGRLDRLYGEIATVEAELRLIALATLTIDVYLTYRGRQSSLAEGNPVIHRAFDTVGFAAIGLVKVPVLGTAGFYRELRPEYGVAIAMGLSIPWLVAVLMNATLLL
jgi:hypothetical protein